MSGSAGELGGAARARKPIAWVVRRSTTSERYLTRRGSKRGANLRRLQEGEQAADWKPMPSVGLGVIEIRLHNPTEHRLLVVTRFADAIYVLHVFEKKSRKTPWNDLMVAKRRYKHLLTERSR